MALSKGRLSEALRLAKLMEGKSSCPPHWNKHANNSWFLLLSCVSISAIGFIVLLQREELGKVSSSSWPWLLHGLWWVIQGAASVCADVFMCGRSSIWHSLDKQLAVGTFCLSNFFAYVVFLGEMGFTGVSAETVVSVLALSLVTVGCYGLSGRAQRKKVVKSFIFWHSSFHYVLVLAHSVLILGCLQKSAMLRPLCRHPQAKCNSFVHGNQYLVKGVALGQLQFEPIAPPVRKQTTEV